MTINAQCGQPIVLGWQTENMVEAVLFDKSAWIAEFGPGAFQLVHKRRGDAEAMPVAIEVSDGIVRWNLTAGDVLYRGNGEAQLRYYNEAGQIKASEIYQTRVERSLVSDPTVPEPMEGWVEQVIAAAASAELSRQNAETAETGAQAAEANAEAWATGGTGGTPSATNNAKHYAEQAGTASAEASAAQSGAETAQAAAEAAQTAAETAQAAAEAAQNAAEAAQTAAEAAQNAAETANTAAQGAKTDAASSATAASGSATNAASSASAAASSAASVAASAAQIEANKEDIEAVEHALELSPPLKLTVLGNAQIKNTGVIEAHSTYKLYYFQLSEGKNYLAFNTVRWAYYADVPAIGSTAIDNTHHTGSNITAQTGAAYAAVQILSGSAEPVILELPHPQSVPDTVDDVTSSAQTTISGEKTSSYYVQVAGTTAKSSSWDYYTVPVTDGDIYTITTTCGSSQRGWLVADENGTIRGYSSYNGTVEERTEKAVIPPGVTKLYVNCSSSASPTIAKTTAVLNSDRIYIDGERLPDVIGTASANLYKPADVVAGQYYTANGDTASSQYWNTVLIDISDYDVISYSGLTNVGGATVMSAFFGNGAFVSAFKSQTGSVHFVKPDGVDSVGFSVANADVTANVFSVTGLAGDTIKGQLSVLALGQETADEEIDQLRDDVDAIDATIGVISDNDKLQKFRYGHQNAIWSWWTRPVCYHYKAVRDRVYYGFVSNGGYVGVGMFDLVNHESSQTLLKKSETTDDHNCAAVLPMADRHILCAYPGGHNSADGIFVRVSKYPEDISDWNDPVHFTTAGLASYSQLMYVAGKYWLFYRCRISDTRSVWCYRNSTDGATWSDERQLVYHTSVYYILCVKTNTNRIRFCCTTNPNGDDLNIRMGFIDAETEAVYNADNETVLRAGDGDLTDPVAASSFTVMIDAPESGSSRLFDVLEGTAPADTYILYCRFTYGVYDDSVYYLYNNGSTVRLCDGGRGILVNGYQLGAEFVDSETIVLGRNASYTDIIETVGFDGTVKSSVYSEATGSIPIRNARPQVSHDGQVIMWHRGYYYSGNFTTFDTDAVFYYGANVYL